MIYTKKHGVSFETAQKAFRDENRVITKDKKHSKKEERHFCIGNDGNGILTVRIDNIIDGRFTMAKKTKNRHYPSRRHHPPTRRPAPTPNNQHLTKPPLKK